MMSIGTFVEWTAMAFRLATLLLVMGFAPPDGRIAPVAKLDVPGVPNVVQVHAKVLSGGVPEDDQAFARLAALGVKTIISVDGMKPDVETAKKYGMRYIHLPHGYDGIPKERAMELAKAVRELPGKVFIHCHHGRHRSPAATAVACVGAGLLDRADAETVLKIAGTGQQYLGLFDSAKQAKRFEVDELDRFDAKFREVVPLPPLAQAMVEIDGLSERIAKGEKEGWKTKPGDRPAQHSVVLLREHYRELLRDPEVKKKPMEFLRLLEAGESKLAGLEDTLADQKAQKTAEATNQWKDVQKNCRACHAKFRDVPFPTKPD
jgi:protein tyrosine phosphatase (PTP) superfamily phosphohydrolase (DUF442 family)